jgi:iron complex outermembrane receptor protein
VAAFFFEAAMKSRQLSLVVALLAATALTPLAPAFADNPDEIVVTARKREEAAKDVPVSLTVMNQEQVAEYSAGGADISFLAARTPSVNVESSFGRTFPRFYIRGLGNTDFDLNASQPVSLVYDEVVFENPVLKGFPIFDVARVEVLRGPQGTLFGRNTPAGIVKFDSVQPSEERSGYARLALRNLGGIEVEGAAGGKLAEGLSGRISLLVNSQDDWVTNRAPGTGNELGDYTDTAGRVQLRFQPNAKFDATLNVHGRKLDGTSQLFRANVIRPGVGGLVSNFDRDSVTYDGGAGNRFELESTGAVAKVSYDFGPATLTSVTGYETLSFFSRGDIDGGFGASFAPPSGPGFIPFSAESADGVSDHEQITQELRLASNGGKMWDWLIGAYYFSEKLSIDSFSYDTLAGGAVNGFATQTQDTDAWALFGSLTARPTDKLSLTAGVRYSDDKKDFVGDRFQTPTPFLGSVNRISRRASVGDEAFSWDVSAVYELNDAANLYARVARGFRAPAIQGRILFGDVVTTADSEFVTSYETGVKGSAFDGRLRGDLSVYYYEIEDQQFTAIGGAGNFNQLLNADKGVGQGVEASLDYQLTDNLSFAAGVAYNDTKIEDRGLEVAVCGSPFPLCTVRDPVRVAGAPGVGAVLANINGNSFPNAPEWTGNVALRYERELAGGGAVFASTDWAYKGETNFFLYDSAEFREDGFWEGGVRVGYRTANERLTFAAFGRNITDEERLLGGIDFNNLTGFVNNPRIFGAEVKVAY